MTVVTLGIRPVSMLLSVILLRLLSPEIFGLVAMAMIIVGTANTVTNWGMQAVIVQSKNDIEKVSFYAFVIVMTASVLVTILTILFAVPLSRFLGGGEPLVPVLRWMALYITIGGVGIIPNAMVSRQLRFGLLSVASIPGELAYAIIAIPLAILGYGVWSLVVGRLLGSIISVAIWWAYCRPWFWLRPRKPDPEILKPQLSYGTRVTGGAIMRFFQSQGDTWYVGRFLGTVDAGIYSKAYDLTTRLTDMITLAIFGNILFPSYARIQDDRPRLARAYLKSTSLVLLVIVPLAFGLTFTAPLMVKALLGDKWLPMIPVWQVFSLYSLTRPVSTNSAPIFLAVGHPQKNITASAVLLAVMIPSILILAPVMGVVGVALAVAIAYTVAMVFNVYQVNSILPGTAWKTLVQSLPTLLSGSLMAAGLIFLGKPIATLVGGENLLALLLLIVTGALIYGVATFLLQRELVVESYELVIQAVGIDRRWPRLAPNRPRPIE